MASDVTRPEHRDQPLARPPPRVSETFLTLVTPTPRARAEFYRHQQGSALPPSASRHPSVAVPWPEGLGGERAGPGAEVLGAPEVGPPELLSL